MQRTFLFIFVGLLMARGMTACAPSEEAVGTAIALTERAAATDTPMPSATFTASPTETLTPTPTPTATPEPTATPDRRIITEDPGKLLLEISDLPKDGRYYIPNSNWVSPHRNSEVVSGWGVQEGREYLERTGRVDGWVATYKRGTTTVNMPEEVYCNIIMYKHEEGASVVFNEYNFVASPDRTSLDWRFVDEDLGIGDSSHALLARETQPNGRDRVWLAYEFTHRNYMVLLIGWGWEDEVTDQFMRTVAETMLEKVSSATLSPPGALDGKELPLPPSDS